MAAEPTADEAAGERQCRLFGLTLSSSFAFASRLGLGRAPVDLRFACSPGRSLVAAAGRPIYESPLVDEAGESLCRLHRLPRGELMRFGDGLDFYLGDDSIDCHLRDPQGESLVEVRLLGPVMAYWLERMGICVLHASAVVVDGRAVVFLASHHGGKSGLAATMMTGGAPLLTDDVLPLEASGEKIAVRPGYPQMRMWPDHLRHFVDGWRDLQPVIPGIEKRRLPVGTDGFGAFFDDSVPPAVVYLPERRPSGRGGAEIRLVTLSPREALIELVRNSFSPFIVEAVGLQARRLELLGRLASRVPVRRLVYPSGSETLPRVRYAVIDDLQAG